MALNPIRRIRRAAQDVENAFVEAEIERGAHSEADLEKVKAEIHTLERELAPLEAQARTRQEVTAFRVAKRSIQRTKETIQDYFPDIAFLALAGRRRKTRRNRRY